MPPSVYPVPAAWAQRAHVDAAGYEAMYRRSLADPEGFWAEQARPIDWMTPWTRVKNTRFDGDVSIKWFEGGKLNVSANCLDRHLATRGNQVAIIWEGDDPATSRAITYAEA